MALIGYIVVGESGLSVQIPGSVSRTQFGRMELAVAGAAEALSLSPTEMPLKIAARIMAKAANQKRKRNAL